MHLINAQELRRYEITDDNFDSLVKRIVNDVESTSKIRIDKDEFSFNRFLTHLRYYLKRIQEGDMINNDVNTQLITAFKEESLEIYKCTKQIVSMIDNLFKTTSTDDEMFYLMIYVNRIVKKSLLEQNQIGGNNNG